MDTVSRDQADAARLELWIGSVEKYHEKRRQEMRARWYSFHADMSELHRRLSEEHQRKAEKLMGEEGEL